MHAASPADHLDASKLHTRQLSSSITTTPNSIDFKISSQQPLRRRLHVAAAPSNDSNMAPSSPSSANTNSYYGLSPEQASREFDVLRREATRLERLLEDRVARYAQLAQRLSMGDTVTNNINTHSDDDNFQLSQTSSLLDSAEAGTAHHHSNYNHTSFSSKRTSNIETNIDQEEALLSTEITRTLSTLSDLLTTKMAPLAERTSRSQHSLLIKRYREILFDVGADFKKTNAMVSRRREALELFRGATTTGAKNSGEDLAMEQLLRERNAIDNSLQSASSVLNQAASVRLELKNQGTSLRGVTGTIASIAGNIPGVNGLIEKIRQKRLRDDRVVSGVVAGCILFTLWYLFG